MIRGGDVIVLALCLFFSFATGVFLAYCYWIHKQGELVSHIDEEEHYGTVDPPSKRG
jgi:hypothetical protein